jgi:hypothetical protein
MALMALGVTTLMGTSAALATPVDVSGTVGCIETFSSLTGVSVPSFGAIATGGSGTTNIAYTLNQGTKAECGSKTGATVSAAMSTAKQPSGQAAASITELERVIVSVTGGSTTTAIPVNASVPSAAKTGENFGATVVLTLAAGS